MKYRLQTNFSVHQLQTFLIVNLKITKNEEFLSFISSKHIRNDIFQLEVVF